MGFLGLQPKILKEMEFRDVLQFIENVNMSYKEKIKVQAVLVKLPSQIYFNFKRAGVKLNLIFKILWYFLIFSGQKSSIFPRYSYKTVYLQYKSITIKNIPSRPTFFRFWRLWNIPFFYSGIKYPITRVSSKNFFKQKILLRNKIFVLKNKSRQIHHYLEIQYDHLNETCMTKKEPRIILSRM